jgi:hypothetical protein
MLMANSPVPPSDVADAAARLAEPKPMRRGSVAERFMKCGQAGCRCHEAPKARHGPYLSVTRVVQGQTRSRYLTAEQAEIAKRQVETGQEFRKHVEAYWQVCEHWADAQLDAPEAASETEAAKKGGSRKPSTRKPSPRSKRS